jgi:hypothetical protein
MKGLNEKAAIDNILIELKDKLKSVNPNEDQKRDSFHYTEQEGREINKMFQKFKLITMHQPEDIQDAKQSLKQSKSFNQSREFSQEVPEENYFKDMSFEDLSEYKRQMEHIIQKQKVDEFMGQVKNFNKKAFKFHKHLEYISGIIAGDVSRIDPNRIPKDNTVKHKFGDRVYNYSKFTGDQCDNSGKGTDLEVSGIYYWKLTGILFISFLTRQLMTYKFESSRQREHKMLKLEEIQTKDFFTGFLICQSLLSHNTYYLQTIENFFTIKVYAFNDIENPKKLLAKNITN